MFQEMRSNFHLLSDRLIDREIINGIIYTIRALRLSCIHFQSQVDSEIGTNFLFLVETTMKGIEPHVGDIDKRHAINRLKRSNNIFKLTQEAQIIFEIEAQVADLVFQHSHTFDAHTQSES